MGTMNRVFLLGNLTRDPELRYLPSGSGVAELRLAVNRRFRLQSGEEKEETCYVDVVVYGKAAETCSKYLSRGSSLLVEGRLQYDEWEKDGRKNSKLKVIAERTQFVGAPRRAEHSDSAPVAPRTGRGSEPLPEPAGGDDMPAGDNKTDEDNLPF